MYSFFILIILFSINNISATNNFEDDLNISKVEHFFRSLESSPNLARGIERYNFSNPCFKEYFYFVMDLKKGKQWTLKMIDASSKIPNGILAGNIFDLGMFDECLSIKEQAYDKQIRGKHCIYGLKLKNMNFSSQIQQIVPRLSICVPASCENEDVTHILKLVFFNMTNISQIGISDVNTVCSGIDPAEWTTSDITVTSLMGIYILFLITCTILDMSKNRINFQSEVVEVLSMLSLRRSSMKILNMKISSNSFPSLNGMRVLSIIWIMWGHEYGFRGSTLLHINNLEVYNWISSWKSLLLFIAPFAVDTFFTLSGFLLAYHFIKTISAGIKFNIFGYYLHRYIRLTPGVTALLLFSIFITPHMAWGPIWKMYIEPLLCEKCQEKWWSFFLYIHNYVQKNNPCLIHLWYLAVDMQLFWISPIILYPLSKKPKLGFLIIGICFLISTIAPIVIIAINKYPITLLEGGFTQSGIDVDMFNALYVPVYTRASAWLVGVLLGYLVIKKNIKLNKVQVLLGWIGAVLCFAFCAISFRNLQERDHVYNIVWESILGAICRPIWAFGVAWIIFSSINGYGGPVAKILSWPIFLPLSRISYCMYLTHMLVQILRTSALKTSLYFSEFEIFNSFLTTFVITVVVSFFFSLFFEGPILVLEKIVFRRGRKVDETNATERVERISTITNSYKK